ncbi:MAG: DUF357 domain-containing protein [Halobacteriota archaeon]
MADLQEKVRRYEMLMRTTLERVESREDVRYSHDFMTMARSYYNDGEYFLERGDAVNALICFSYGHAWLDAGIRAGMLFDKAP